MIYVLTFLVILIIINLFIIGIYYSNVIIDIKKIKINNKENNIADLYIDNLDVNVYLYLFKIIKILKIKIKNENIVILGFKIPSKKILKFEKNNIYENLINLKNNYKKIRFDNIKLKLKKFDMKLKIGTENVIATSFVVFAFSTIITYFLKLVIDKYNSNKYNYIIEPIYVNQNNISLDLESEIKIETKNLILFICKYAKLKASFLKSTVNNITNLKVAKNV